LAPGPCVSIPAIIVSILKLQMRPRHALCAVALLGCADAAALDPVPVAPGVYAFVGEGGAPTADNRGRVANSGFAVGKTGVVVIDTGVSLRFGREMLAAIRRLTDRPVRLVIITNANQEFVFGAGAFKGAEIAAHRETVRLMKTRCQHCLELLSPVLGEELRGTQLVMPTRVIEPGTRLSAAGVKLELLHFGWAATPGDLVVFLPDSGVAFGGAMVAAANVPRVRDCDFEGWRAALARLKMLQIRSLVPGFGPIGDASAIEATDAYLAALDARVRALYRETSSLVDALERSDLEAYRHWAGYGARHRQNFQHRYLQLEIEDLGGDPRSTAMPDR
jgi:glyoxylase-like metal-dependent hydrolase (beta-lactamase superfamily II)